MPNLNLTLACQQPYCIPIYKETMRDGISHYLILYKETMRDGISHYHILYKETIRDGMSHYLILYKETMRDGIWFFLWYFLWRFYFIRLIWTKFRKIHWKISKIKLKIRENCLTQENLYCISVLYHVILASLEISNRAWKEIVISSFVFSRTLPPRRLYKCCVQTKK